MLIATPGSPLNALKDTSLVNETLSKIVPRAFKRNFGVEMVHSKLGLCNKNVANAVNLKIV